MTPAEQMKHMAMLMTTMVLKYGKSDLLGKAGTIDLELSNEDLAAAQRPGVVWDLEQELLGPKDAPEGLKLMLKLRKPPAANH